MTGVARSGAVLASFLLMVSTAARGAGAEKAAPAADAVIEVRQKAFDAARGPERAKAGAALVDALLEALEAKADAKAYDEALALARRAQTVAAMIGSPRTAQIGARLKTLLDAMKVVRDAEALRKQLDENPQDAALREKAVRAFLVDLDDPAEAATCVEGVSDETLRKYVPAAAKGVEAAPELACAELAAWYRGLAETASPAAKVAMLSRAQDYYERFLGLHTADDLERTKAAIALQMTKDGLKALGAPARKQKPAQKSAWIDLLAQGDPAKDGVAGSWQRAGAGMSVAPDLGARLMTPLALEGDYEVEVRFVRTAGDDMAGIILPVADTQVCLIIGGYHGQASGLDLVNGKRCSVNETKAAVVLENNRPYTAVIQVQVRGQEAQVSATLEGKPLVDWKGPPAALSLPTWFKLPGAKSLGLTTWGSAVTFESVRLKMLSGEAKPIR